MVVYVTEQGATVSKRRGRLIIHKGSATLERVRVDELEQLVLVGHVQVSSHAQRALMAADVDVVYLNQAGRYLGRVVGAGGKRVELQLAQHRVLGDGTTPAALELARRVVRGKIHNQRRLLLRRQRTLRSETIARSLVQMRLAARRLLEVGTLDEVRGLEGMAAAAYFGCLGELITAPGFMFTRRLRRPPPDPVNILLSFGYTLLTNLVHAATEQVGLYPYLGALHAPRRGRPSLALDLVEEWRPVVVDAAVLSMLNRRALLPTDFVPASEAPVEVEEVWEHLDDDDPGERRLIMSREASKKWFIAFERRLSTRVRYGDRGHRITFRQAIREQAYALARHLLGEGDYQPFELPL